MYTEFKHEANDIVAGPVQPATNPPRPHHHSLSHTLRIRPLLPDQDPSTLWSLSIPVPFPLTHSFGRKAQACCCC